MKRKTFAMIVMAVAILMIFTSCGASNTSTSSDKETDAVPSEKQTTEVTLNGNGIPVKAAIDISDGYSVESDSNAISLFEEESTDSTMPVARGETLEEETYTQYIADNQGSKSYLEVDGMIKYLSEKEDRIYLYKIGDKVPFMITVTEGIDESKADELASRFEMSLSE